MSYSFSTIDKEDHLFFQVDGEANDLADVIAHAESIIFQARKFKHKRLLLDETALSMSIDTHDAILFANWFAETKVAAMGLRAAVVCAPCNRAVIRAFETALRNRSISYKMFDDLESASEWLLK